MPLYGMAVLYAMACRHLHKPIERVACKVRRAHACVCGCMCVYERIIATGMLVLNMPYIARFASLEQSCHRCEYSGVHLTTPLRGNSLAADTSTELVHPSVPHATVAFLLHIVVVQPLQPRHVFPTSITTPTKEGG